MAREHARIEELEAEIVSLRADLAAAIAELDAVDRAFEGLEETDRARRIGQWIATAASERTACQAAEAALIAAEAEIARHEKEQADADRP